MLSCSHHVMLAVKPSTFNMSLTPRDVYCKPVTCVAKPRDAEGD